MRILFLIVLLFLAFYENARATPLRNPVFLPQAIVSSAATNTNHIWIQEDFENPAGYTWTNASYSSGESEGKLDPDYTTNAINGSESLYVRRDSAADNYTTATWHEEGESSAVYLSEVWIKVRVRYDDISTTAPIITLWNSSGGVGVADLVLSVSVVGGKLRISDSAQVDGDFQTADTANDFLEGMEYYAWIHYQAGSGSDGIYEVAFNTTDSEPTSGGNYASITNSDRTLVVDSFFLGYQDSVAISGTGEVIFDDLLVQGVRETNYLLTEDGDILTTESGDRLILE